jgi:hypothetical protein
MTDQSSQAHARDIADKLATAAGAPIDVRAATGQIYALLAVVERLDAITDRLDRLTERLDPAGGSAGGSAAGSAAGSAPLTGTDR